MRLRTLRDNNGVAGKRVLLRVDLNVPIKAGRAVDGPHGKVARAAVDVEWLRQRGARVVVLSHLGRPEGKHVSAYSLRPVVRRMGELLGTRVLFVKDVSGAQARRAVGKLQDGEVLMLENVRFDPREERNSTAFAQELSALADVYVNDAFSVCHRAHTSVDAITSELPSFAGPLLEQEVSVLEKAMRSPRHPFFVFLGGLKIRTKLPLMRQLLPRIDRLFVSGAIANTFFHAREHAIGMSVHEKSEARVAHALLKRWGEKIALPQDVVVARACRKDAKRKMVGLEGVGEEEMIVDVGDKTLRGYAQALTQARTVIWNGPVGWYECEPFAYGSRKLARMVAKRTGKAVTVVGGGDTVAVAEDAGVADRFTLLSTGGGAMLAFLAGKEMPGLEALKL